MKRWFALFIVLGAMALGVTWYRCWIRPRLGRECLDQLRAGMTKDEVRDLFGSEGSPRGTDTNQWRFGVFWIDVQFDEDGRIAAEPPHQLPHARCGIDKEMHWWWLAVTAILVATALGAVSLRRCLRQTAPAECVPD